MANGETAGDLHKEILSRCGELDDGSSPYHSTALSYLNKAYQKIIAGSSEFELDIGEPWVWAQSVSPITLALLPFIGTNQSSSLKATFTFNSTAGTFSTIPQQNSTNISLAGWMIQTSAASEWYQIKTHVSGSTSFVLDAAFNDTTAANASFLACLLDYTLTAVNSSTSEIGGIQRLAGPMECYRQQSYDNDNEYRIYGIDIREFKRLYPLSLIELGIPTRYAITSQVNGVYKIRFNKYVDLQTRVDIPYLPVPQDLTSNPDVIPVIPREFRDVLVYAPCWWLLQDKNDDRAPSYKADAQGILKAMLMDSRKKRDNVQKQRGALIPRYDNINQKKRITYL